jgi:hypothetical protein
MLPRRSVRCRRGVPCVAYGNGNARNAGSTRAPLAPVSPRRSVRKQCLRTLLVSRSMLVASGNAREAF